MQSNGKFLDLTTVDVDRLSSYERFQLAKYGNILKNTDGPLSKFYTESNRPTTAEESHVYSLENPNS